MKRALVAGVWLLSMACTEAEEEVGRVPLTLEVADGTAGIRLNDAAALTPSFGPGLTIDVGRAVHWVEVERCAPGESDCAAIPEDGYCYFDVALLEWETAMGENIEGTFDDALRGEPAIVGPIVYGQLPANAGWQSDAAELVEGERYAVNAYVYEACDDNNAACIHTKAVGCQFFVIEDGELVDITE